MFISRHKDYSTGEVARICRISPKSVIRCFDSGLLGGHIIPGTRHRRIPGSSLIEFMDTHNISQSEEMRTYSLKQAARILNMTLKNVHAALRSNEIEGTLTCRQWSISEESLQNYKDKRQCSSF
jgi:DNA-binding CsgD family transcriptional regulator